MMMSASQTNQSLWRLVVPPTIWAAHFIASYATVSIWCSKVAVSGSSFGQLRLVIIVYSVLALAGIGITGWIGYSECSRGAAAPSQDTPESRYRFLGYATLLLAVLSGIATAFAALAIFFFRSCA
jgi:hypothetical protein